MLILVGALVLFGLVVLSSASGPLGYQVFGDYYYYIKHQILFGVIPGFAALLICLKINYHFWRDKAMMLFVASLVLMGLVFIPGIGSEYGTARSWINIFGFSFQPSELVKLTFLFYLAAWLEARGERKVKDLKAGLLPFLIALGFVMILMILQPDIGTMSIIVLTAVIVYISAGASWLHVGVVTGLGILLVAALIKAAPYRAARFMTFLHPELDPQGIGYHINQALLAIGSGGIFGLGLGHSKQKFQYLPEVAGDSIFAIIGEEMGIIFSLLVVAAFLLFLVKGFKIAMRAKDDFGKFMAVGITSWLVIQAFVNIGSMVAVMPMTGVPLPFISAGGSALAVSLAAVGILLSIDKASKKR